VEPNLPHDVVKERHDGDPAQPVPLLQLGKQHRREVAPALFTERIIPLEAKCSVYE